MGLDLRRTPDIMATYMYIMLSFVSLVIAGAEGGV